MDAQKEGNWSEFRGLDAYEVREVAAGDLVRPWIGAGPFFNDVSEEVGGRSFFEDLESDTGESLFRTCLDEGERLLVGSPSEGDELTYRGETLPFAVIDNEEPLLNWGRYFRGNTMVAKFHSTQVTPAQAGVAQFRSRVRIDNQLIVAVNGKIQYRSFDDGFVRTNQSWLGEQILEFELELGEGKNVLSIGAFRMGRIAGGSFYLQTVDTDLTVRAPLRPISGARTRRELEAARDIFHPSREWFYAEDRIRVVRHPDAKPAEGEATCEVLVGGESVASADISLSADEVDLGSCHDIGLPRSFQIRTTVALDGSILESRVFPCTCIQPTGSPPGTENYEGRRQYALEHFGERKDAWGMVARYVLGRPTDMDREAIEDGCTQIDRRLDCADFILHPFLRLLYMDRVQNALPDDVRTRITESALGFRYWTDEPGSDCLVTGTENHQILFHTAEIIAGHLWPDEVFPNAGMTGREHIEHGRALAVAWMRNRALTGFREWHSSSYYPHWMSALLDLHDCVPDEEGDLKKMAVQILTAGCLNLASDSYEGSLVTTHGRVYAPMLKAPDLDGCSGIHWLLYGEGNLTGATAVVPMAAGTFRVPEFFERIATSTDRATLTRHHQGNDARFIVQRTPDYLLCALQDYKAGEKAAQVHPFQITFKDKVAVFFSCPETTNEGGGHRPDYWSGNGYLPRVFGERNVALILCKPGEVGWVSHCYFERDRFCEVVERDGWLFARKADGYLAIWSEHGYEVGARGPYAGRELVCRAGENAWIVEAGRRADCGSFEKFVDGIVTAGPRRVDDRITYTSPSVGRIEMGWEGPIVKNGTEVDLDYPLLDGPYGYSEYESGEMKVRYEGEEKAFGPIG